ncbi:AraC family transcriptional regulator [Paenibacillus sp. H1-7]|uniref:AraC family transcriptional regulator n=1 Tax=Paenibacillus sp. H1-7 TaxID=2282849 RepID=UPI001EF8D2F8|nr:AraC family transcriptional regulator [Paenibacillus sp. H1-7]ULL16728.1 AraC family transcriptional regulator [Paenibacillus sp. H1-7]
MFLYSKEQFLECEEFPFAILPFLTMPTRALQPHYHDFIELVYVAEGHGEHLYKGNSYPLSKGDTFVIAPGVEHDYRVIGNVPLKVYNIMFMPSFLTSELEALSAVTPFLDFFYVEPFLRENLDFDSHLKLSLLEGHEMKQRIDRIFKEYDEKALGYRISIKAQLIDLLIYLSRCYDQRVVKPVFHNNESKAIRQLCEFLELHYAQPIQLEQVCRMCGMSQTTFTSKFKQMVGKTFTEYRNEVRIRASLKPLRETEEKIIEIAESVGIRDVSHFNHLFKQHLLMTPREYRIKHRT